ncbi:NADPH-dependent FMN reductase [Serratia marcescens]|uniref:NADPH-dependent FMN reductase n=1 Tax=Serratia marcescens TaxID=615 RepID=UPI0030D05737
MTHIIGISGSLRSASFNHSLLQAAVQLAPESVTLDVRRINGIPLYDADVEVKSGIPASVVELKEAIAVADGVLLATPEYNNGIPGVFKNAIDWVSRPDSDIRRVFGGKPFALIGASPGDLAQSYLRKLGYPCCEHLEPDLGSADGFSFPTPTNNSTSMAI